jgi:DNA-binding beta-propeller fold protein YncE
MNEDSRNVFQSWTAAVSRALLTAGACVMLCAGVTAREAYPAGESVEPSDTQLHRPEAIALGPDGTVYVADRWYERIYYFTALGSFKGHWRLPSFRDPGDYQYTIPNGVAVDPDGKVYVTDAFNKCVQYYSPAGSFLGRWSSAGSGEDQSFSPEGIAVGPNGKVYVCDRNNHRIQYFDESGSLLGAWGSQGSADGQFLWPEDIAVTRDGFVYVCDWNYMSRIQYFTPSGSFLGKWGSEGKGDGQFDHPAGIAVAPNGVVYVTDRSNNCVQYFSRTGSFMGKWGLTGSAAGEFKEPYGIAVAANGDVYVVDTGNYRVQYFSSEGSFKGAWGYKPLAYTGADGFYTDKADFRGSRWGDTVEQVMEIEGPRFMPVLADGLPPSDLLYNIEFGGHDACAYYIFSDDRKLMFVAVWPKIDAVDVFFGWEDVLSRKYGEPTNADLIYKGDKRWLNNFYGGGRKKLEAAILAGYFDLRRRWDTENTEIWLIAEKDFGVYSIGISFYSKKYREFLKFPDELK